MTDQNTTVIEVLLKGDSSTLVTSQEKAAQASLGLQNALKATTTEAERFGEQSNRAAGKLLDSFGRVIATVRQTKEAVTELHKETKVPLESGLDKYVKKMDSAYSQLKRYEVALNALVELQRKGLDGDRLAAALDMTNRKFKEVSTTAGITVTQLKELKSQLDVTNALSFGISGKTGTKSLELAASLKQAKELREEKAAVEEVVNKYNVLETKLAELAAERAKVQKAFSAPWADNAALEKTIKNIDAAEAKLRGISQVPITQQFKAFMAQSDTVYGQLAKYKAEIEKIRVMQEGGLGLPQLQTALDATNAKFKEISATVGISIEQLQKFKGTAGIASAMAFNATGKWSGGEGATVSAIQNAKLLQQESQAAQDLVNKYTALDTKLREFAAERVRLQIAMNTPGIDKAAVQQAIANLNVMEAKVKGFSQNAYQQNQILRASFLNAFQGIAAGQPVLYTLYLQGTQALGAIQNLNLGMIALVGTVALTSVAALGLGKNIIAAGDSASLATGRLNALTGDLDGARASYASLEDIAIKTGISVKDSANLMGRLTIAQDSLGASREELLRVSETLQKLSVVSGATGQEAAAGLRQLSQSLASGKLNGDELRSVLENIPLVAKAIAEGFMVDIGQLREMGKEGQLTGVKVFEALLKASNKADTLFANMPTTVSRATGQVEAAWDKLLVKLDVQTGLSQSWAQFLSGLSVTIDSVANNSTALLSSLEKIKDMALVVGAAIAGWGLYAAGSAIAANFGAIAIAAAGMASAVVAAGAAMLTTPVGWVMLALGGIASAYITLRNEMKLGKDVTADYSQQLIMMNGKFSGATTAAQAFGKELENLSTAGLQAKLMQITTDFEKQLNALKEKGGGFKANLVSMLFGNGQVEQQLNLEMKALARALESGDAVAALGRFHENLLGIYAQAESESLRPLISELLELAKNTAGAADQAKTLQDKINSLGKAKAAVKVNIQVHEDVIQEEIDKIKNSMAMEAAKQNEDWGLVATLMVNANKEANKAFQAMSESGEEGAIKAGKLRDILIGIVNKELVAKVRVDVFVETQKAEEALQNIRDSIALKAAEKAKDWNTAALLRAKADSSFNESIRKMAESGEEGAKAAGKLYDERVKLEEQQLREENAVTKASSGYDKYNGKLEAATDSLRVLTNAYLESNEAAFEAEVAYDAGQKAAQYGAETLESLIKKLREEAQARALYNSAQHIKDLRDENSQQELLNAALTEGSAAYYDAQIQVKLLAAAQSMWKTSLQNLTPEQKKVIDALKEQETKSRDLANVQALLQDNVKLQESISLQQTELSLVWAGESARERILALEQLRLSWQKQINAATGEGKINLQNAYEQAVKLTNAWYDGAEALKKQQEYQQIWNTAGEGMVDAFADFFATVREDGESAFEELGDAILDVFQDLQKELLKTQLNAVLNVTTNLISGTLTGTTTAGSTTAAGAAVTTAASGSSMLSSLGSLNTGGSSIFGKSLYSLNDIFGTGSTSTTTSSGSITSSGTSSSLLSGLNVDLIGGAIGGLAAYFVSDALFDWETEAGQIGSSIGSTIGASIGTYLLPGIGTFAVSLLGDALGGFVGDLLGDVQTPRGGSGYYITESGQIATSATWGLDGVDEQDMIDMAEGVTSAMNTILDALGTGLSYTAMDVPAQIGYTEADGYYTSQTVAGEEIRTAYASMEEAVIGLLTDLLGYTEDALPEEVQTALETIDTTDADYFTELVVLAASWTDLLDALSGNIDYQSSILSTVQDTIQGYTDELQSLQDMASDAGLSVDDLNEAYADSLLIMLGLKEGGEEAMTDLETTFWEVMYSIQESADLFQQIGYGYVQTQNVISDALTQALEDFQTDFYDTIEATQNSLNGLDVLNTFDDYIEAYQDDLSYADLIRADTASLNALWASMVQDTLAGAENIGTALLALVEAYPEYTNELWAAYDAVVDTTDLLASAYSALGDDLTGTLLAFDAETTSGSAQYAGADLLLYQAVREAGRAQEIYDYYAGLVEDSIDTYQDLIDSNGDLIEALYELRDTAAELRLDENLAPGALKDLLAEAELQYTSALTKASDISLPTDERVAAIQDVDELVSIYLGYARDYYGSSLAYSQIFNQTQEDLIGLGEDQIYELEAANDNAQAQIDALQAIDDSVTSASAAAQLSAEELQALISEASSNLTTALASLSGTLDSYNAGTLYVQDSGSSTDTSSTTITAVTEAVTTGFDQVAYEIANAPYSTPYNAPHPAPPERPAQVVAESTASAYDWYSWTADGSAAGNVFGGLAYGVYDKMTPFRFAAGGAFDNLGVLGEAGPEAILPLGRGPNGNLGVHVFSNSNEAPAENNSTAKEIRELRKVAEKQAKLLDRLGAMLADKSERQSAYLADIADSNAEMATKMRRAG